MALPKLSAQMPKPIFHGVLTKHANAWLCRAFVTSTRPCERRYLDRETCDKVKEAAQAVTEVVKETRETGKFVKQTIAAEAGKVISEMADKAIEKVTEEASNVDKEEKSAWQKVKEVVYGKDEGN